MWRGPHAELYKSRHSRKTRIHPAQYQFPRFGRRFPQCRTDAGVLKLRRFCSHSAGEHRVRRNTWPVHHEGTRRPQKLTLVCWEKGSVGRISA